ncbi:SRPBCC family protein [Kribbella sp. NPDC004536]|uniref:SRPBCC family protein n=1 Tax=Kribbella sp. NPDC004536 TaxID=3364106 RepID=UPI0036B4ACD5
MPDLTESITVRSTTNALYRLVSNLPRMPEWSPECTQLHWTHAPLTPAPQTPAPHSPTASGRLASGDAGAVGGPVVGARFVGYNRAGFIRWFTFGRVVTADPGRRFTFDITFGPIPISRWDYSFTSTADGCTVTESWTDHRPRILKTLFRPVFGNRTPRNAEGIHTTLTRLKSAAEAAAPA